MILIEIRDSEGQPLHAVLIGDAGEDEDALHAAGASYWDDRGRGCETAPVSDLAALRGALSPLDGAGHVLISEADDSMAIVLASPVFDADGWPR